MTSSGGEYLVCPQQQVILDFLIGEVLEREGALIGDLAWLGFGFDQSLILQQLFLDRW